MTPQAFWNLAGRAGRWGKELAGNIFALDVHDETSWPSGPPRERGTVETPAPGSDIASNLSAFLAFAAASDPAAASRAHRTFEHTLGELVATWVRDGDLTAVDWWRRADQSSKNQTVAVVASVAEELDVPEHILERHSAIHPILISRFLAHLRNSEEDDAAEYIPAGPGMTNAAAAMADNFRLCDEWLGADFGSPKARMMKAIVTIDWVRSKPIGEIIASAVNRRRSNKPIPAAIRDVLGVVDDVARFRAPKYLGCYATCVREWYTEIGRNDLANDISDIEDMLETGAASKTMLTLLSVGLTRVTSIALVEYLPRSDMNVKEVGKWVRSRDLARYGLSPLIIREAQEAFGVD